MTPRFIEPGSPWENGYVESFNGKLRDECLNRERFDTLLEAQILIEGWRREYNQIRPHSALGLPPPRPGNAATPGTSHDARPGDRTNLTTGTTIGAGQRDTGGGDRRAGFFLAVGFALVFWPFVSSCPNTLAANFRDSSGVGLFRPASTSLASDEMSGEVSFFGIKCSFLAGPCSILRQRLSRRYTALPALADARAVRPALPADVRNAGPARRPVDGSYVKVHQHAAGPKSGRPPDASRTAQAIGRSRGGLTTKLMALVDRRGRFVRFTIRPGNTNEGKDLLPLLGVIGDGRTHR